MIEAESFDGNAGGTSGIGVTSLRTNRYWNATVTSGATNLTDAGRVSLYEASPVFINGTNHITTSTSMGGTYIMMASAVSGNVISSSGSSPLPLGYYVIGTAGNLGGNYTVGASGDFSSLTNAGGLFSVLNASTITSNITATVISDISIEDGSNPLYTLNTSGGSHILIIQSDGTVRTISGSYNGISVQTNGLIRIDGADGVVIDGGSNPADRKLVFRNTFTNGSFAATLNLINNATNNTFHNCTFEGSSAAAATATGVVNIGTATPTITGNDDNNFSYCDMRNRSDNGATPVNCFYSAGTAGNTNDNNTIDHCNIYNFNGNGSTNTGVTLAATGNGGGWNITNNSIFFNNGASPNAGIATGGQLGINFISASTSATADNISGNYIGGSAP